MNVDDGDDSAGHYDRPSKRRRTAAAVVPEIQMAYDETRFKPGYILKVRVTNFTTYSYGEFNLLPSLNMIIGPNGAGKSTLVSAICLGLGGKLELIKRKTMKSVIKTGCTDSTIEITLKNKDGQPNLVIERAFTERTSAWTVNGQLSDAKTIKGITNGFNIQLDNLCHFLPQERVAEFATLSPEKLLIETQRTLGDGSLYDSHELLITMDSQRESLKEEVKMTEEKVARLQEEKLALEEAARKYKDYQEKSKEIQFHKMLVPYAQFQDLKNQQKAVKEKRAEAKKKLDDFKVSSRPLQDQIDAAKAEVDEQDIRTNIAEDAQKDALKDYKAKQAEVAEITDTVSELNNTITALKTRSSRHRAELDLVKVERVELVEKLERNPEASEEEIEELKNQRAAKHDESNEVNAEIDNIDSEKNRLYPELKRLQREVRNNEDKLKSTDKISILEERPSRYRRELVENSHGAHFKLRRESEYQGRYFDAPVVSCAVTDKAYAKYVEKVIDNNTLYSIFSKNRAEHDKISEFVLSEFNTPMRICSRSEIRQPMSSEEVRKLGFDGYLSDFVTGPPELLESLNQTSKLHLIPVSRQPITDSMLKALTSNSDRVPFMKFMGADQLFTIHRSKYGSRQSFYGTEKIWDAQIFGSSGLTQQAKDSINEKIRVDRAELKKLLDQYTHIDLKYRQVKEKQAVLQDESTQIANNLRKLQENKKVRKKIEGLIAAKDQRIAKLEASSVRDYTDKIKQTQRKIVEKYHLNATASTELSEVAKVLANSTVEFKKNQFLLLQCQNRVSTGLQLMEDIDVYKEKLVREYEEAKRNYDQIRKSDSAKKIQEQSLHYTNEDRAVLSDYAQDYMDRQLLTEKYILEKIQLLEDEISVMSSADKNSLATLSKKKSDLHLAENELPRMVSQIEDLNGRIAQVQLNWEAKLTKAVTRISRAFQKRFVTVASDGRVELVKEERFKDWRLQILVKFRENSELKILDHLSQSGGERAVSTIFFVMSLQGLTNAPFRIVDEINQGMDPRNERLAHKYLVQTACKNNNSQYFLVTPKLLTGLYYHPEMAIHCIYTGALMDKVDRESEEIDFMDFMGGRLITGDA